MQALNSNNFQAVTVMLRNDDKPITMAPVNGAKLMDYLIGENSAPHVGITDVEGNRIIVRTTDILRVEPVKKLNNIEEYV